MASYKDLQEQITKLQQNAEEVRMKEIDHAIEEIRALMSEYGLSIQDIESFTRKKRSKAGSANNVQFRDDSGNTWSGRGRMPAWLKGKNKEQFRVS